MRKHLILLLFLLPAALLAQPFSNYAATLSNYLVAPGHYAPLPVGGDTFWRDSLPATVKESYIRYGEAYKGKPWATLSASLFSQFKTNGNRVDYEQQCFAKRRQLAALVMAEVIEGKERFLPDIIDGLQSFCEETWWGIPAHYKYKVPVTGDQTVDLFNAETASLIAWTGFILAPQLDRFSPLLNKRIGSEIKRRILVPALKDKYWWKTAGMNWNPWICSNWLTCVLLYEQDRQQQLAAVTEILSCMDAFYNSYPEDGGCDEGPGYWDRAAASLYECLTLLHSATSGHIDVHNDRKLRAMGAYAYKTYIGKGYVLSFADSHDNRYMQQLNIVYPFASYLGDGIMKRFAHYIADDKDFLHHAAELYDRSGNFPTLGRELFFLRSVNNLMTEQAAEPLLQQVWLPNLQIWTSRAGSFFAAMKGGNNGESHNHNDVGQVVVYGNGEPLLIDAGVGEYTSKTFSNDRYSIWTMQSGYHNLPQINGCDQRDGKQYHATVISQNSRKITMELSAAYPAEAAVSSWQRTLNVSKKQVVISDRFQLKEYHNPTRLMFMTTVNPDISKDGIVSLGSYNLHYNASALSVSIEDISSKLDPLLQGMWGKNMYRIVFTLRNSQLKGNIQLRLTT